jgi:chaperonin GroES
MLKPINDRVVIKPEEVESVTKGGIIIPDTAKEKPLRGTVVAIGASVTQLEEGQKVLYGKYAGQTMPYEGEDLVIMRVDDVFAILD